MLHDSNLEKIKVPEDIHSNIEETFDFINHWLPVHYADEVLKLITPEAEYMSWSKEEKENKASYIRKVKKERINNKKIYTALYRIALFSQFQLEKIST